MSLQYLNRDKEQEQVWNKAPGHSNKTTYCLSFDPLFVYFAQKIDHYLLSIIVDNSFLLYSKLFYFHSYDVLIEPIFVQVTLRM